MSETPPDAKAACLRWLAGREYSRAELRLKLQSKGFDKTAIQEALAEVEQEGLQDDGRFLSAFVRSRAGKGQGPQRIRQELQMQGIDREKIEESLAGYDWDESLEKTYGKKFGGSPPASPKDYASRVRFLCQRGFEQHRIQALLQRLRRGEA